MTDDNMNKPLPLSDYIFVDSEPSHGPCRFCGETKGLRMGACFDCATKGEEDAYINEMILFLKK